MPFRSHAISGKKRQSAHVQQPTKQSRRGINTYAKRVQSIILNAADLPLDLIECIVLTMHTFALKYPLSVENVFTNVPTYDEVTCSSDIHFLDAARKTSSWPFLYLVTRRGLVVPSHSNIVLEHYEKLGSVFCLGISK